MPVLALRGERSRGMVIPQTLQVLAENVLGGVVERAVHWMPEDSTAELVEWLVSFLRDAAGRSNVPPQHA